MSRVRYQTVSMWMGLALACGVPAWGQYPGRVDTSAPGSGPHLRATAVVEYTGTLAQMKSSRLVPVAVWDGTQFQPGGLYLAQPAPLAVLSGTQYELEEAGRPKGFYNIGDGESLAGLWIGVGHYEAPVVKTAKLQPAKVMPYRVTDVDPDKPHFAHRPADEQPPAQGQGGKSAPAVDPDRPTLHERPKGDTGGNTAGDEDPDRPTFHREKEATAKAAAVNRAAPEVDPDRPRLEYKAPEAQEKLDKPDALFGLPEEMEQVVGVSDPKTRDADSWKFSWSNPEDAAKMKAALEKVAEQMLTPPAAAAPAKTRTVAKTVVGRRKARAKAAVAPPAPMLTDEEFKVYSLTFGGGATMVLSARTAGDPVKYVTIVAQPDFYGNAQVLLKRVTSANDLDVAPRMRLVDAVDPRGDGRADLLFELRGRTYRQFALYRIGGGQAVQEFVTPESRD